MLTLQLLTIEEVSFATLQCGLHPLRRVRISNTGSLPLTDLRVVVKTAPRFLEREEYALPSVGAGESIDLIPHLTDGLSSYLLTLREAEEGVVSVGVLKGEEVLAASEVRLTLLPLTVWMGTEVTPTLHAAYVEGGHPALTRILQRANKYLERTEDKLPLCGYEIGTVDGVRKQVAALYHALSQEGITVGSDPAVKGCPVRSYDRLLEEKIGSCLDISLFFAGILEAAGFNPILIFTDRYVEVGVWLSPRTFPESVQDDAEQILRRAALGIDEICVIDPACACANVRFDTGCETALARLKGAQNFLYALDIRRARLSGIPALPARKPAPDGSIVYYPQNARQDVALGADVTPGGTPLTRDRLWERRLLDLSLRNSLLNFLPERRGVPLFASSVGELATLCNRGGDWLLSPRPQETVSEDPLPPITGGLPEALLHSESLQGRIRTAYREEPLKTKLNGLYRTARTSLEESGANPLYLAIGFLKWYENEHSKVPRYAPLVLLPAELVRKNAPRGFALRLREEEPTFNVTLLEFLKSDFDLQLPIPDTLPRGDWGINLQLLFNTVRRAVLDRRGWDVVESASLAAFSFGRFILWNDLHNRKDILRQNRIVSGLIEGGAHGIPQVKFPTADDLDGLGDPTLIAAPLPADSSQLSAIAAAGVGASFVLHGPPGTGKSQTITNMIANALYTGKTVLFVADKMAALSVVESRLAALGLSPFCLELHSDKAKKSHVLEQLSATLESGAQERPVAFEKMAERLAGERDRLRGTLHLLHRTHPSGMSLYDAIVGYERYLDAKEVPCFPRERVAETTAETYRDTLIAIREYGAAADRAGGVNAHPLSFYEKRTANPEDKATLTAALEGYLGSADCFTRQYEILSDLLPLGRIHAYDQIKSLAELCKKLSEMTVLPAGLVSHPQLLGMKLTVDCLRRAGEERNLLREELLTRFDSDLLAQNAGDAIRAVREADLSSLLTRPAKRKKERVKLAVFAKDPSSLSWADVMPVWESVAQYQALGEEIETLCATAATLFGGLARGKDSDTVYLGKLYDDACAVKHLANATVLREEDLTRLLSVLDGLASDGSLLSHCDTFRTFVSAFEDLNAAEERVASACACEAGSLRILTDWPASETLRFRRGLQKLDDLRDYVIYLNKRDILWQYGLKPLTDALEEGRIHTPDLLPAFLRSSCLSIAEEILVSDPALSSFSGAVTGEQIRLYRETSKQFRRLTASEIIARLSARIPHPDESAEIALELGTLNRAIRAGGRGMSLRKLFDSIPHVLPRLSPCMLMSPLSVAQYVSAELPPFDLVIFDEASQMPTCEAVSAIARGKSLIVVGDPNQLPPTSFFTATHGEDEGDAEILESLLDDCLALGMPEQHLAWHYRSRHESLITFSNRSYYGNRLSTFPSPTAPVSHVRTVHVGGCYDRGKTKTNRAEAEAVVSEVLRRLSQKETPPTMGIVTFASPQQALIEDLLEERLASDPALARKAEGLREPIFVKNLENVQGDERDVIFFSVCYGPDKQGRVALNFGPLNREGGWRRLNVAVTRAREEMLVFSTLLPEQIDLSRTTSEGVAGLRAFLEYARSGEVAMTPDAERHERPTEIAHAVAKALAARGYETDTHVGTSDCRVDVAIRDPQREGEYLLGILTDERAAGSVGDRFEIREQTLARLGWSLYRLWSIDYWDAPAKILDQIEAICHTANKMRAGRGVLALDPLPTPQETVAEGVQKTYASPAVTATAAPTHRRSYLGAIKRETYPTEKLRPLPEGKRNTATFFSPEERETVLFQIRELLLREAPISHNLLCKRICEAWGIRLTPRADGYLTTLVGQTVCTPRDRGGVRFYWNLGQEASEYATFRLPLSPADRREPEDIPLEEMASAIAHLAESRGSLSREDTLRDTARMFGFARIPAPLETRLDAALELAIRRATVAVRDGRVLAESIL